MKRLGTVCMLMLWAACEGPEAPPPGDQYPPELTLDAQPTAVDRAALITFGGGSACADLEQHLEDRAVLDMKVRVLSNKRSSLDSWDWNHRAGSPWGTGGGSVGGFADGGSAAGGTGGSSGGSGGGPGAYTTTNTQVAGVDEADFVKNDGTRLFVLSGRSLFTASTWPASSLARRGQLALDGMPKAMFLEGDRVVVFSSATVPGFDLPSWCDQGCGDWYSNATLVTYVDVSDLSAPRVVARQQVPGAYFDARRIGHAMRVVTTQRFAWLDGLQTWVNWEVQQAAPTRRALAARYDALAVTQEAAIRARTLAEWLPAAQLLIGGQSTPLAGACEDLISTSASAQLGLTNVVTLDVMNPAQLTRQVLLAQVNELHQSHDALYLGQRQWWWWPSADLEDFTFLYRFDVTQPDRARFSAAGRIDGYPVNQFALDEHDGHLRVATTAWDQPVGQQFFSRVNRVVVLEEQSGALVEVGRTPDLAPGEQIMSARFFGDVGYLVTFRQVDPLYTLDLSTPTAPRVVGELKIPGFSSYLHPLDATHLLTIGTYVSDPASSTWERYLQLQIFDVSDPAHPLQTHTQRVGQAWGWSEAQWDHKAFNFFPARGLLAVPFADWYYDNNGAWHFESDLRVFHVDPQAGFESKGALDMKDVLENGCGSSYCWSWYWQPTVRRSVMADDYVYAISSGGVRVAHVDALDTPLATARFEHSP